MKKILLVLVAAVIALAIFISRQPEEFAVTRSITISAPAASVYAQVNNLHNWEEWSPWAKLDPDMKHNYEGPAEGVGASYVWAGNSKVGEGRMTIIESHPDEMVRFNLEFLKPFKGNNTADFTFKAVANQTTVTWTMNGKKNFAMKAMGLVMNCDKMVGAEFEKGLAQLKAVVEAVPKT